MNSYESFKEDVIGLIVVLTVIMLETIKGILYIILVVAIVGIMWWVPGLIAEELNSPWPFIIPVIGTAAAFYYGYKRRKED